MGGSHSHRGGDDGFAVARLPRTLLLGFLAAVGLATVIGLVVLWPDGDRAEEITDSVAFAGPGVTFPTGTVERTLPPCDPGTQEADCGQLVVEVDDQSGVAVAVPPEVLGADLERGDEVRLVRTPGAEGQPATYGYFGTERSGGVWVLVGLFVLVVVVVARLRGVLALIGLGFAGVVLVQFVFPALLTGEEAVAVGLVGSAAIMYVVLFTTHGFSLRTSAALAGTHVGVALTALLGWLAVRSTHLTGIVDESGNVLSSVARDLDFQGLVTCAVLIAGLGVLNDVTITQASAVWELRAVAPGMTRRSIFGSAMRIGRDHVASSIYTIVFAYAGTALGVLLVLQLYGLPLVDLLATEEIGLEVVRTLVSSIGLVLAMPVTTAIAAATVPGAARIADHDEDALVS